MRSLASDVRLLSFWFTLLLATDSLDFVQGGCNFPKSWEGRWFLSGVHFALQINSTHIETKGECYEVGEGDKYLVYDRSDDCYRCMAIHQKHASVLQYKETYCEPKASLQEVCYGITGDAALYSMFRKFPEANPIPCPFKSAPFTFSYNRGTGDCSYPASKAESCTDDSRLVLKYQACPDIPSTESNVEELVCLAIWKEGSTRYLIGKISQWNRRSLTTDEDQYRCFIYQRSPEHGKTIYNVAQSGDATCSGLQNVFEGSRTMRLTAVDDHHNRCKFPAWITDHHTLLSLDKRKIYRFSQRNATLKILDEEVKGKSRSYHQQQQQERTFAETFGFQEQGFESQDQRKQNSEMRVVCHGILEAQEQKRVQIVAHITAGCDSGFVCMVFYKRDNGIIEIQQSEVYEENPDDACRNFEPSQAPFITLTTVAVSQSSHPKKCPHVGKYSVVSAPLTESKRKKRQHANSKEGKSSVVKPLCRTWDFEALAVGCNSVHEMEFKSACPDISYSAYTCHGNWQDNGTHYVIASPTSSRKSGGDQKLYCLIYTMTDQSRGDPGPHMALGTSATHLQMSSSSAAAYGGHVVMRLSAVSDSCHRHVVPGVTGNWFFNFTHNGTCADSDGTSSSALITSCLFLLVITTMAAIVAR